MKILQLHFRIIAVFLFSYSFVSAQTVNTEYATQINNVFEHLDKTRVPHKLLVDYAMEFAELSAYSGRLINRIMPI